MKPLHYVYIIQSLETEELYFGRTDNLEKRLQRHNAGENSSTREKKPWDYVYVEGFRSKKDAVDREKKLKQYGNARAHIKNRIHHSLS